MKRYNSVSLSIFFQLNLTSDDLFYLNKWQHW